LVVVGLLAIVVAGMVALDPFVRGGLSNAWPDGLSTESIDRVIQVIGEYCRWCAASCGTLIALIIGLPIKPTNAPANS